MVRYLSLGHSSVLQARRITRPSEIYEKETVEDETYIGNFDQLNDEQQYVA